MTVAVDSTIELIVPHMSRWDLLERLLASVDAQTRVPSVCVVDNASTDDSLEQLALRGDVRVIALEENIGVGRAINRGVRTSTADYVMLLNNDMVLDPEYVARMAAALEAEECAVSGVQLAEDGSIDTLGVGFDQSLDGYDVGHGAPASDAERFAGRILGPSGASGFRRSNLLAVGGYDEAIFAYLEDLDLAIRLQAAAIPTRFVPDAIVHHRHSATLGSGTARKNELLGWSRGYVVWKYRASIRPIDRMRGLVIDAVIYVGKALIDRNLGAFRGRIRFIRERGTLHQSERIDITVTRENMFRALARRIGRR